MKILYVSQNRIPSEKAYAIQIMKMCEAFYRIDKSVRLVTLIYKYERDSLDKDSLFVDYSIKDRFKIDFIDVPFLIKLGSIGYFLQGLVFIFKIIFKIRIEKNTIIYTRDWLPALIFNLIGYKVFFEVHTHHGSVGSTITSRFVDGVVVISNGLKDFYIKKGVKNDKIFVSPSAVDLNDFNPIGESFNIKKYLNLSDDTSIVLYTGHLYEWKGIDILIKVSKMLPENVKIVCIGGTKHDIFNILKNTGSNKSIFFIERKNLNIIPLYMRSADIFIIPNTGNSIISRDFTSPLKIFTYMAMKKPIVVSNLLSMREILDDNCAYFFEPDDDVSCKNAILEAINDKKGNLSKIDNAYKKVLGYTWDNRASRLLSFLGYTKSNI